MKTLSAQLFFNIAVLSFLGISLLFFFYFPVQYIFLIAEDGLIETTSFVCWFFAATYLIYALVNFNSTRQFFIIIFALTALIIAFEEISWGQRFIGFQSPIYFKQNNYQGELTLHNLISAQWKLNFSVILILITLLFSRFINIRSRTSRFLKKLGLPIVPFYLWPIFILALFLIAYPILLKFEEIGEGFLAIGALFFALHIVNEVRISKVIEPVSMIKVLLTTSFSVLLIITLLPSSYPTIKNHLLTNFAKHELPTRGHDKQSELLFEHISNNSELQSLLKSN